MTSVSPRPRNEVRRAVLQPLPEPAEAGRVRESADQPATNEATP